ncbi:SDR family oxidoreductase [Arthrobacter sp. MMS18-M83]|uniref:SDR family oxidoreductase n=1 Tax=Arthrobacter sp. MMS18-M83 TaxID=2996261 RepID=UPI00227BEC01|nr:SDR family oxidoreductase [Arthrobacter sp. MMS18-M83]WAH96323.1 SDR family oxidoreductase [Arthrobacter sp. MMS18-M83]
MTDLLNYAGKVCVVTGASSGMGKATAKLLAGQGATVYALDINEPREPLGTFIKVNLGNRLSIDEALAALPAHVDAVFSCAGIAGEIYSGRNFSELDVLTINFIGGRYLIEGLIPRLPEGGSIAVIASTGGMRWQQRAEKLLPFATTAGFEEAQQWFKENRDALFEGFPGVNVPYMISKEALIVWMKHRAYQLSGRRIRLNSISPASTATPMSDDFSLNAAGLKGSHISLVGKPATPADQAKALVFLNSDLASYVSGQDLQVDYAFTVRGLHGLD